MLKPVIPGKPAVNRFKRGGMYLLKNMNFDREIVGIFKQQRVIDQAYTFYRIADNKSAHPFNHVTINKHVLHDDWLVCRVYQHDLPLYINFNTLPKFNKILAGADPKLVADQFRDSRRAKRKRYTGSRKKVT